MTETPDLTDEAWELSRNWRLTPGPILVALVIGVLVCAFAALAGAQTNEPGFSVSWRFAAANADGTPLTDLAGARLYYGTASSNYAHVVSVPGGQPGESKTFRLTQAEHGIQPGVTYYLNGTAYNTAGLESDFCAEVTRSFTLVTAPAKIEQVVSTTPERWAWVNVKDGSRWVRVLVRLD